MVWDHGKETAPVRGRRNHHRSQQQRRKEESRRKSRSERRKVGKLKRSAAAQDNLLGIENQDAGQVGRNCHMFESRYSRNSKVQRANAASIIMKRGGSLPGNAIRSLRKVRKLESQFHSAIEGMEYHEVSQLRCFDWEKTALYFFGSSSHKPALPRIDQHLQWKFDTELLKRIRDKRDVRSMVVEQCVQRGILRVLDNPNGVYAPDCFMKLPHHAKQGQFKPLFDLLMRMEQRCVTKKSCLCRDDTEGARVAAFDGTSKCYLSIGTTVNKHGKGFKTAITPEMKEMVFKDFVHFMEGRCIQYLPPYVLSAFKMMHESNEHLKLPPETEEFLLWCSWAIGRNNFLNTHKDDDFAWTLCCVVAEDGETEAIVCYLVFYEHGVVVPLRNGDGIAFNSTIQHCISSRCNPNRDAFYVGFYANAGLGAANDRNVEVSVEQAERAKWMLEKVHDG